MRNDDLFEGLLEDCLQDLARTGEIEASLHQYPQHADRLRPLLELAQATRRYYTEVPEAPGGLSAGRERLLAVAGQQRQKEMLALPGRRTTARARVWRMKLAFPLKLAAVILIVLVGTAALGGGLAWAAEDSLPGELLYPLKLTIEDVRLSLSAGAADQTRLALGFVEVRVEEFQALAAAGRPMPDEVIARLERHIQHALTQAASANDGQMAGLLLQIQQRTRTQVQVLEHTRANAPEQARAGLARAATVCQQGADAAEAGLADPATFRWRYQHRRTEGEPEPTTEPAQERHQYQQRNDLPEGPSMATPSVTPQDPQTTSTPQVTPSGPWATPSPQKTAQGPQATPAPTLTPQKAQTTGEPHATSLGPLPTSGYEGTPTEPSPTTEPNPTPSSPGGMHGGDPNASPGPQRPGNGGGGK